MKEQFFLLYLGLLFFLFVYVRGERHSSENPSTVFVSREGKRYIFLCNSFPFSFILVWRWQRVSKMVDKNRKFVFFFLTFVYLRGSWKYVARTFYLVALCMQEYISHIVDSLLIGSQNQSQT
jgi:hypothetical protein